MRIEELQSPNPEEQGARVVGEKKTRNRIEFLRNRFIAGLITIIPTLVTIWALRFMFGLLDRSVGDIIRPPLSKLFVTMEWPLSYVRPLTFAFSLLLTFLFVLGVGILTRFIFIRRAIHFGEGLVEKIPLIRFFYVTPKEVLRTLTRSKKAEKRVVLIEFPRPGIWAVGYATSEVIRQPGNRRLISVFIPTTPNPTSGFLLLVDAAEVYDINLTTENAVRFIISGGILSPHNVQITPFVGFDKRPDLPPPDPLSMESRTDIPLEKSPPV